MKKFLINIPSTLFLLLCPFFQYLFAQTEHQKLSQTILHQDSLFWTAYNTCDTVHFSEFFTEDVEFYHDKGGVTLGLEKLTAITKKNLCCNSNFRLRREAVEGSVRVFPLQSSNVIYGAIISGEHVFYILENDKEGRLDGLARFSHVWLLKDSIWKMARILSYDHGPASYINKKKEISISNKDIDQFVGNYRGPKTGSINIQREKDLLRVSIQNKTFVIHAESKNRFFVKDRDLSFEFIKNQKNGVSKLQVWEQKKMVEEAIFINKK